MLDEFPDLELKVVVIGIGDTTMKDQGVGVHAVEALRRRYALPPPVSVVAVGEPDRDLLDALEEATHLIAVDCVLADLPPGSVSRVTLAEYEREEEVPQALHEQALLETLGVLEMLGSRPAGVLFGVQVGDASAGTELSPPVAAAIPAVVDSVVRELERLGLVAVPSVDPGMNHKRGLE